MTDTVEMCSQVRAALENAIDAKIPAVISNLKSAMFARELASLIHEAALSAVHHGKKHGQNMLSKPTKSYSRRQALLEEQCDAHDIGEFIAATFQKRGQFCLLCLGVSFHSYQVG